MTEFIAEASERDLAEQGVSVGDEADEAPGEVRVSDDADVADVVEQQQPVPSGEDDYAR